MSNTKEEPKILFVGEGHGAHSAFRSLAKEFNNIYVLSGIDPKLDALAASDKLHPVLTHEGFDLIVTAGYRHKFPNELIEKIVLINIHYALLPRFRGLHSLVWAMLNHEPKIGLTMHIVNGEFDAGPILHQYAVDHHKQTSWEFMHLFDDYVEGNLGRVVRGYWEGDIQPMPQDSEQAVWCCRRNLDDCKIDFNASNKDLEVFFRALVKPYPIPFLLVKGISYGVVEYEIKTRYYTVPVGRVVNVDKHGAWIKVRDGFLVVKTLESPEGTLLPAEKVLKLGMRL